MPIYEYLCQSCGHKMEALQKMSDEPLVNCPNCCESELKKQISAAGFRLSGTGWYETDFKSGKKKNISGEQSPDSGSSPAAKANDKSGADKSSATSSVTSGSQ
ncbi:MAG: zinc ribbon domain-containing protein [Porticoccaceae bacterium]|jgi:putative FmdB family regulatory protein|nr:zinc ribbon domain-containing protein [Porticoccaceae bacterium]